MRQEVHQSMSHRSDHRHWCCGNRKNVEFHFSVCLSSFLKNFANQFRKIDQVSKTSTHTPGNLSSHAFFKLRFVWVLEQYLTQAEMGIRIVFVIIEFCQFLTDWRHTLVNELVRCMTVRCMTACVIDQGFSTFLWPYTPSAFRPMSMYP